jgi:hypothetical protein
LACTNLAAAGVNGDIYCRDAFDLESNENLWGGPEETLVPNLQGVNWILQRMVSLCVLQAHVVYSMDTLPTAHDQADLER